MSVSPTSTNMRMGENSASLDTNQVVHKLPHSEASKEDGKSMVFQVRV